MNRNGTAAIAAGHSPAAAHRLADEVRYEARDLVGNFQNAVSLATADVFVAGHHQVNRLQPYARRNAA